MGQKYKHLITFIILIKKIIILNLKIKVYKIEKKEWDKKYFLIPKFEIFKKFNINYF